MKSLTILSYLLVFAALNAFGQTQAKNSASGKASSNTSIQKQQGEIVSAGTITNAELTNAIDVRKSKVGDSVVLKTTKSIKQNGETVIPKGTRLVGRITEIQQKSKENGQSRIGMLIDRIEGNQISAPINVSLISMATAAANVSDVFASDSSSTSSNSTARGSTGSGGLLNGVTNTVGGVVNTATQTAGSVVGTASQTIGNTTGTLGRTVNGIQLSQSASGSASGSTMLSSQNKNLRIEKGASFNVRFDGNVQN